MTTIECIITAAAVEKLAKQCTTGFTPSQNVRLDVLERVAKTLQRRGWELTIYNKGTITVVWVFMLRATAKRVCRVVRLIPV